MAAIDPRTLALQEQTSAVILPLVADPTKDIAAERKKATFDPADLAGLLYGSKEKARRRKELVQVLASDPAFSKEERYFKNQQELYEMGLRQVLRLHERVAELGLTDQEEVQILSRALGFNSGADLHFGMFLPTILGQGTQEQKEEVLGKALSFQIFGTYAQTEMGHGTFLRGLETSATYDPERQEFVVHSPTITATKWWPGGLAKTANHVVLMARLFIRGKDHGPHAFLVQIRDYQNHLPFPGIEVGDIGPKFGFSTVDNGFLRFNHYRVPLNSLLSKNAEVKPDGTYVPKSVPKASYGTMVLIRSIIVFTAATSLAKATTIATRYSAVRRQTSDAEGHLENQVLDYQNQQNQLFPYIATTFALHFTGIYMRKLFSDFQKGSKTGNMGALPELHATSSGLKALVTTITSEGIESCRKACGGHGYSHFSGLPLLYEDYVAACTYEGENSVMHLQTARYLMKAARQSLKGEKLEGNCTYLENLANLPSQGPFPATSEKDFLNSSLQVQAFRHRAAQIILRTFQSMEAKRKAGLKESEVWNTSIVDLIRCSYAHCASILVLKFTEGVQEIPESPLKAVLKQLSDLFALTFIERDLGEFTEDGYLSPKQVPLLRQASRQLLALIRPNAVALVDGWDLHDYELNSALGAYDGNVYQRLYDWAQKAPLNKSQVGPAYKELLQDKFRSNL